MRTVHRNRTKGSKVARRRQGGTSSVTDEQGALDRGRVAAVADEVAATLAEGHEVVLVTSGAIAAGIAVALDDRRTTAVGCRTLQAVAAVGQVQLMGTYADHLRSLTASPVVRSCSSHTTSLSAISTFMRARRSFAFSNWVCCRS